MAKRKGPGPWILLAAGLLGIVASIVWGVVAFAGGVLPKSIWVSGQPHSITLESGDWTVYQMSNSPSRSPGGTEERATVNPQDITITGPDGAAVAVSCITCGSTEQSLTVNSDEYLGLIQFTAPTAGSYTITVPGSGTTMAISRPVFDAFGKVFLAMSLAGICLMVVIGAVIWLIVRSVNGRRVAVPANAAAPAGIPAAPAAPEMWKPATTPRFPRGWYQDSADPRLMRWWDGEQWTENVKPR